MKNSESNGQTPTHEKLQLIIDGQEFEWSEQYIFGKKVKELVNATLATTRLYLAIKKPWEDELILDTDRVDLARPGIEHFYIKNFLLLTINGKQYEWEEQYITGKELRTLAHIPPDDELYLAIAKPWKDELINAEEKVDLARPGIEHFYSTPKHVEKVVIHVDDKPRQIFPGDRTVAEIKKIGEVTPGYELDQLIQTELVPLKDDAVVCIKGGEQFFSHVKDGTSS